MYVSTDRKISLAQAAALLNLSVVRVHQFLSAGRLRRLSGVSRSPYGRKHVAMVDLLEAAALAEQRSACPPRPGRPKKVNA